MLRERFPLRGSAYRHLLYPFQRVRMRTPAHTTPTPSKGLRQISFFPAGLGEAPAACPARSSTVSRRGNTTLVSLSSTARPPSRSLLFSPAEPNKEYKLPSPSGGACSGPGHRVVVPIKEPQLLLPVLSSSTRSTTLAFTCGARQRKEYTL